jgi:hypothetical protein
MISFLAQERFTNLTSDEIKQSWQLILVHRTYIPGNRHTGHSRELDRCV